MLKSIVAFPHWRPLTDVAARDSDQPLPASFQFRPPQLPPQKYSILDYTEVPFKTWPVCSGGETESHV